MDIQAHNKQYAELKHVEFHEFEVCAISIIKAGFAHAPANVFLGEVADGDFLDFPDYAFLIEKQVNGSIRRYLFDLGLRKDGSRLAEAYVARRTALNFESPQGIDETLLASGVSLSSIDAIIMSHTHWDHVGDLSRFPKSVALVLGLDSRSSTAELAVDMDVDEETLEGRQILTLNRKDFRWTNVGAFEGVDFFKDGSLFLLNSPGVGLLQTAKKKSYPIGKHRKGHLSALVRISNENNGRYVLCGGDTCHSIYLLDGRKPVGQFPAPDGRLRSVHDDLSEAYTTIARTRRMEQEPNIITVLAHDTTLKAMLEDKGYIYKVPSDKETFEKLKNRSRVDPTIIA